MPEPEAFFHDLRALRASAGLSLGELARLAHFPQETLAAAEAGPALPPNPVLVAYVRACGGPVGQWEDRWRDASAAAAAFTLVAAGTAVALTRPAAHTDASARPRTSPHVSRPDTSRPGTSRPRSLHRHPAAAPRMTSVLRVTGIGCPAGQDRGVTLTTAGPGRPWTAGQGGWAGDGCDGTSVWTMNPAGKQPAPSTLTWWFGALPAVSRCTLSVYVPTQNALGQAGYAVSAGSGGSLGTVTINQAANAGQWVVLGTFPAAGSGYQIQLMPEVAELTAAGPAANGPGGPGAKPVPPGHNSAVAASAAATACSG